jgi:hypothetical protein
VGISFAIFILILLIIAGLTVDGIIRQMHVNVFQIAALGGLIGLGGESRHALIEEVHLHWVDTVEQNVYSQVKLQAINQVWRINVVLSHHVVVGIDVLPGSRQKDSLALRFALGLDDEDLRLSCWHSTVHICWLFLRLLFRFGRGYYHLVHLVLLPFLAILSLLGIFNIKRALGFLRSVLGIFIWLCRIVIGLVIFRWLLLLKELTLEQVHFIGQDVSRWEKVIILWELFEHEHQILT